MHPFFRPVQAARLIVNPSFKQLREMTGNEEKTTIYGSASFISKVRNRSAKNTYVLEGDYLGVDQNGISLEKENKLADSVHEYLKGKEVISLDRQMGQNPNFQLNCRLYITKEYARIPFMWYNMLFEPAAGVEEPDLISIYVPEWPERVIFVHPEAGITYILGTDYFGEVKKSFLRMALYNWKKRCGIGFHAGSKVLRVRTSKGVLEDIGFIMFGLSGTGKTTLTIHDHGLQGEERVIIRQDDMVMMDNSGYCYGTENGFYIKTEGLDESQRVLYNAATSPNAILENVKVLEDGTVLFDNSELTSNGRCVILRKEVAMTDEKIDLDKAHRIIFITRRDDILPVVAKLNAEQAAAYFMLGESIETSAGDPTKAGQSKREVGTNPFIIGREYYEGNKLLEILKNNRDMECYLLNTGSVGQGGLKPGIKVPIRVSTNIMKQIAKGTVKWTYDPDWGYQVPVEMPEIDISQYNPVNFFNPDDYQERVEKLRRERIRWLAKYKGLKDEIIRAIL
ncbi:MAG TPA: phosphoenolpyruvate carboxykinase (ATP) [Bacillota bacterium]|nr:phosphoenolpyruvate carboxykinase (ATP) [Bacillota bacterium]